MISNFQLMFRLEVFHSYYEQHVCNCLWFKPGAATNRLIRRFNFKIRNNINGFDFYARQEAPVAALLSYVTKVTGQPYFDFEIGTTTSQFHFFTDFPADWFGHLLYDSANVSNRYEGPLVHLTERLSENISTTNVGSLFIHFDDIVKLLSDKECAHFNINFKARSTQWQYFIINKSSVQLNNPSIGKADINFIGPENVIIDTGQHAILFSSADQLIPLRDVPKYKFDLVNNPNPGSSETKKRFAPQIIFRGLPNPDPTRIATTVVNGRNQISSPMYVYI